MSNRESRLRRIRTLLGSYLDVDRLLGENPSVRREDVEQVLSDLGTAVPSGEELRAEAVVIYSDGASSGNPGPSGVGFVLTDESGAVLLEGAEYIGETTNNVAEYRALRAALDAAARLGARRVTIHADSELLVRQLNGQYKVKSSNIRPLYADVRQRLDRLEEWTASHLPRDHNERADALARQAVEDGRSGAAS